MAIADLTNELPHLVKAVKAAPNVSLVSREDLAAGRPIESSAFVEAMRERGFAVTGVARYPDGEAATRAGAVPEAAESWRVKLEMDSFHVVRAVGDQWGGRDEIYFTSAASVGGDDGGQTFRSEEFGAVKQGDTRTFSANNRVFLDKQTSSGSVIASVQVWEADQSGSGWYSALQQALNTAVERIDAVLGNPAAIIVDPTPLPVTIGYEVAKIFISLMDLLRNNDDLSCTRMFALSRDDLAVLHHRPVEWNFNGDGHHKLTVRYTGERPVYPAGSIEVIVRNHGLTPDKAGPWSAPIPLGWKTRATPALTEYRNALYTVFARASDNQLMWSRYDGAAWTTPSLIVGHASDKPPALAAYQNNLHLLYTGAGRTYLPRLVQRPGMVRHSAGQRLDFRPRPGSGHTRQRSVGGSHRRPTRPRRQPLLRLHLERLGRGQVLQATQPQGPQRPRTEPHAGPPRRRCARGRGPSPHLHPEHRPRSCLPLGVLGHRLPHPSRPHRAPRDQLRMVRPRRRLRPWRQPVLAQTRLHRLSVE
ncbi:hypothetical protein ACH427_08480 [Streptomyces sp. NPDC020379]|uniref:hypothetical protein n=1 Tax=Streptomyces sp. NPDC020379 TaxID=3365071 RepID=UPI0037B6D27A